VEDSIGFNDDSFRLFTLENRNGTKLVVSNLGAAVVSLFVRDSEGHSSDVVLGYDNAQNYLEDDYYLGTVVGRFANRIKGTTVVIEDQSYQLSSNHPNYLLHGGKCGFNKKFFSAKPFKNPSGSGISLTYTSPHLEEGFPGELRLEVTYFLDEVDNWTIEYTAVTDRTTIINLTQHSYFNLSGNFDNTIERHEVQIYSDRYLPVNELQVPTGELASVANTPFDFGSYKKIARDINADDNQLKLSGGYDHSFVLKTENSSDLKKAVSVKEPTSGRQMDVYTSEPAVHFYSGNFLQNVQGKNGAVYNQCAGFCLETQHFPDAPNHPHFPSTVLKAGDVFRSKTVYQFKTFAPGT